MLGLKLGLNLGSVLSAADAAWYTLGKADDTDPSFWADFANDRYAVNGAEEAFSDIFTFTRSTTGTYFDANGVMQTAAINTPRFDHNPLTGEKLGLLIEEQRTNLVTYSEDLSMWAGTSATTLTSNVATAPDGNTTADKISDADTTTTFRRANPAGLSVTSGVTYTVSCYVQAAGHNYFYIRTDHVAGTLQNIAIDLTNGSITRTPAGWTVSVQDCGGGWYRLIATAQTTATAGRIIYASISSVAVTSDGISSYAGTVGSGVYVWGFQFEQGAFATSYIPTTSTAVTRSADTINSSATNTIPFADWYNIPTGGTIFTATDTLSVGSLFIGNTPSGEKWDTRNNSSTNVRSIIDHLSGSTGYTSLTVPDAYGRHKTASTNFLNSFIMCFDGVLSPFDGGGVIAEISSINLMKDVVGHIKEFRYYPIRVSNASLQELTT